MKLKQLSLFACTALLVATIPTANAQLTETWNVKPRERSGTAVSRGVTMMRNGFPLLAIKAFQKATEEDPTDPKPFRLLGMALIMQGEYAEALDALQKSYSLGSSTETLLSTGMVYYLQHDYDAAINAWQKVIDANPKSCNALGNIGWAYLRKGQLDKAENIFLRLVKCNPHSQLGYCGLAYANFFAGDLQKARQSADRAQMIQVQPQVTLLLANIDFLTGDRSRCKTRANLFNALAKRVPRRNMTEFGYPAESDVKFDPYITDRFDNGYLVLARLATDKRTQLAYARQGKALQTASAAQNVLSVSDHDFFVEFQLGLVQLAAGDYSSAKDSFTGVLEKCNDCSSALLGLGLALTRDGKSAEGSLAIQEYRRRLPTQELAPQFIQISKVDPGLINETHASQQLPPMKPTGPKPVPAGEF